MTVKQRVDKIADNTHLSLDTLPTTCKVEISGLCTLNCVFCYHQSMVANNERQKLMSNDDFSIVIKELQTIPSLKEVGLFYMGESGLHPLLKSFYQQLKEAGYFTFLTTNGTITKNIIDALPYIDSLKVSWNYRNKEDFIQKTQKIGLYDSVKSHIKQLYDACKALHKEFTISTVLDSSPKDYSKVLKTLPYDEHYYIPLQTQAGINESGKQGVVGEYEKMSSPMPCWSLFKGIYIDVDLNVRMCCYGHYDKNIIGNLRTNSLKNILKSDTYINIKKQHLQYVIPYECEECLKGYKNDNKE